MALIWRPGKASQAVLVLVACVALIGCILVECLPQKTSKPYYREKLQAAKLMDRGMEVIKHARISIFGRIDTDHDPNATGMIGSGLTPITSDTGVLGAKQTSANPNFAALIVHFFKEAKLKQGDVVAMGFSGSFPSLNLASLVAAETLGLKPIVITSVSASNWGANDPELTWLDMERLLFENNIIHHRSVAGSMGSTEDRGGNLPPKGIGMVREAIARNGIELIDPLDLESSFDLRMTIYKEEAHGKPISCYVNVGGSLGSVGSSIVKKMFSPGLNRSFPETGKLRDSVMTRMSRHGIPVINLIYIDKLANQYGLAVRPTEPPKVGKAGIYAAMGYNMTLVWSVLVGLAIVIFILLRMDLRHYIIRLHKTLANTHSPSISPKEQK